MRILKTLLSYVRRAITWDQAKAAGLLGTTTQAGVSVTAESALTCSPVYAAVRKITSAVGTLPFALYQRGSDDGRTRAVDHPVYPILHDEPNPQCVPFTFWSAFVAQMLLHGRGLAEIETNLGGDPIALWLLPSKESQQVAGGFEVAGVFVPDESLLHVPYFSLDGISGKGIIEYARETIGTAKAIEQAGASFAANMVRPSGGLTVPSGFSDQARENLRASIREQNAGSTRVGRLMVLEDGVTFNPFEISASDAQWIESRAFSITDVARFFNISPTKLADLTRATWGNIESENRSYIEDTLLPILTPIAQEVKRKLLRPDERKILYAEHVLEKRLQGNTTERYAAHASAINAGWKTRNEVRAAENLSSLPGLDQALAPMNMGGNPADTKTPSPAKPAQDPPNDQGDNGNA